MSSLPSGLARIRIAVSTPLDREREHRWVGFPKLGERFRWQMCRVCGLRRIAPGVGAVPVRPGTARRLGLRRPGVGVSW